MKKNASQHIEFVHALRHSLQEKPLPGPASHLKMMPRPRPGMELEFANGHEARVGAVLILLYPKDDEWTLVLTKRTETVNHHRGQISLPGGRREPNDKNFTETAQREAFEELGVSPESQTVIGALTPLYIPPSDTRIYPIVAYQNHSPQFLPSQDEVASVIEMPLSTLLNEKNIGTEMQKRRDLTIKTPFFNVKGHQIWGATAMVLAEFRDIALDAMEQNFEEKAKKTA